MPICRTYLLLLCLCILPFLSFAQIPNDSIAGTYEHPTFEGGGFAGYSYEVMEIGDSGQVEIKTMSVCYALPPDCRIEQTLTLLPDGTAEWTERRIPDMLVISFSERGLLGTFRWRADTLVVRLEDQYERFPNFTLQTDSLVEEPQRVMTTTREPLPEPIEMWFLPEKDGEIWRLERVDTEAYDSYEPVKEE